jgi:uncharacterized protein
MQIGLISDTHGFLDKRVFEYFNDCNEIWHGGDIGSSDVADTLASFKPFRAVYGNIDDKSIQLRYPENLWFTCEGLTVLITHIAGAPPNYNPRVKKILKDRIPNILICGHSHILKVYKDERYNHMIYINPGAAGNQGFHHMKTIMRFTIANKVVSNLEVIELGKRGGL